MKDMTCEEAMLCNEEHTTKSNAHRHRRIPILSNTKIPGSSSRKINPTVPKRAGLITPIACVLNLCIRVIDTKRSLRSLNIVQGDKVGEEGGGY